MPIGVVVLVPQLFQPNEVCDRAPLMFLHGKPCASEHVALAHVVQAGRPFERTGWALDSGGFSELSRYGGWRTTPEDYVAAVKRYDRQVGQLHRNRWLRHWRATSRESGTDPIRLRSRS